MLHRWLFIIEGTISLGMALTAFFSLPNSAERAWFLTKEESAVMKARKERHIVYKGEGDKFQWTAVRAAILEPYVWIGGLTMFANSVAVLGFGVFLPTIIAGMGYTSLQANYLTIPVYIFAGCCSFVVGFTADKMKSRSAVLFFLPLPTIVGYAMIIGSSNKGVGYAAMFLCSAGNTSHYVLISF